MLCGPYPVDLPKGHPKHVSVVAPTVEEYSPAIQASMQALLSVLPCKGLKEAAEHEVQGLEPSTFLYFPAGQATHALAGPVNPILQTQLLVVLHTDKGLEFGGHVLHVPSRYCSGKQFWNNELLQQVLNPTPENVLAAQVRQALVP